MNVLLRSVSTAPVFLVLPLHAAVRAGFSSYSGGETFTTGRGTITYGIDTFSFHP
jgi:hypothetical protein